MKKLIIFILIGIATSYTSAFSQTFDDAVNYYNQGNQAMSQAQFDLAISLFLKSSEIFKETDNISNYLTAQHALASAYMYKNDFRNAQSTVTRTIEGAEQLDPPNEDLVAELYNIQAQIYSNTRKINEATEYFRKTLQIYLKKYGENHKKTANATRNLASIEAFAGNSDSALVHFEKAKQTFLELEGETSPNLIEIYLSLGQFENAKGNVEKSDNYYKSALDIVEKTQQNTRFLGDIYSGIGANYITKGELENADAYITKAISTKSQIYGANGMQLYKDYYYQAMIMYQNEQLDSALNSYIKSGDILSKHYGNKHPELGNIYNAIALIYEAYENDDNALKFLKRAQTVFAETYGEKSTDYALVCNNVGIVYLHQGKNQEAAQNFEKAIEIISLRGYKNSRLIEPYLNLGTTYMNLKDYTNAIINYQKSIMCNLDRFEFDDNDIFKNPILSRYQNGIKLIDAIKNRVRATIQLYDSTKQKDLLTNTVECVKRTSDIIDDVRKSIVSENDRISLSAISKEVFESGLYAATKIYESTPYDMANLSAAFMFSEKTKAATLLEALAQTGATLFSGIPEDLIAEEKNLSDKIASYKKLIAEEENHSSTSYLKNQLFEYTKKFNALISKFEKEYPDYYAAKFSQKIPSLYEIQKSLDNADMLISYFTGRYELYCIAVSKTSCTITSYWQGQNQLATTTAALVKSLTNYSPENIENYKELANNLYTNIFPQKIPKEITRITIIPDGSLFVIPFEALLTESCAGKDNSFGKFPFLIKKYQINYNYSSLLALKRMNQQRTAPDIKWLGIAPAFDAENVCYYKGEQVRAIPETVTEVQAIAEKIRSEKMSAEYFLRKDASETTIKTSNLRQYNVIHIATHGTVNSEHPELSGLMLSQKPGTTDDGMLYNGEIYNLNLDADLVVMSACETGLGKISQGEGVIGLGRSLIYAGAKNIVCSLWQVSDASTSVLMTNFYTNMLKNSKKDQFAFTDKLHNAKLKMISEGKFAHPYFWSPFIIIGK
ncbi:MAG: CHAT domain-containing protein [Bacteroidales bacterium]|nr:CHAT domain-containing protein [Bacteroidales bacterium]